MNRSAIIIGPYRYYLERQWDDNKPLLPFMMLNPSTADAEQDDATIRKCIGFAERGGYGGVSVVNLFAYRATDPMDLWEAQRHGTNIVGPSNNYAYLEYLQGFVVCAWGSQATGHERVKQVMEGLKHSSIKTYCLKLNADGSPAHPLMLPYTCALMEYEDGK